MAIKVSDLHEYFEEKAPAALAEDWDNVGLLIGNMEREINKALICLDVTSEVVNEAIKLNMDIIISHHPFIFKGIKSINDDTPKGKLIHKLIQKSISVYCVHTNLDVADDGVNDQLAKKIELKSLENLNMYKTDKVSGRVYGLGKYGELKKEMDLSEFLSFVKNKLNVKNLRVIGDIHGKIKTVAVFCGSFDEDYTGLLKAKVDILLTGDIKYHTATDMKEMDLCVIDAGHFYTERIIVPALTKQLNKAFPQIEFIGSLVEVDPFKFT